ncbi:MAG TPA: M20/M25/M40 family metallo-hydrolase [Burkholderiaceae bacterium]|nr:M20/M25/M40 family metallo-hydrolase [Burkholderiaceae bacterium]
MRAAAMAGLGAAALGILIAAAPAVQSAEAVPAGSVPGAAVAPPSFDGVPAAVLASISAAVDPRALRETDTRLVAFGTRHTLSGTTSDTRCIGAARRWVQARFEAISRDCGGCLQVVTPGRQFSAKRIPVPTDVVDVVAIQRGTTDPGRVVIMTAHVDTIVSDVLDATHDAPGADDDGSGVAAVLEAARVLSRQHFGATVVYGVMSGEEQGLFGGQVLAAYAQAQGWRVEADLNNDIVGASRGENGVLDNTHVRVFSEGTKATETPEQANKRRYNGGEVDSPSRNLARFLAQLAERTMPNFHVAMVYRTDRFNRGGDQVPFLEAGYPAVRFTEAHEDYRHQHQDVRTEGGVAYGDTLDHVDFDYLAQVTRLDAMGLAALANAPAPPHGVGITGALKHATTMTWQAQPDTAGWRVWWRDTTSPTWQRSRWIAPAATQAVIEDTPIDDWFFGVSAVSADGWESPVVFPGDPGSF